MRLIVAGGAGGIARSANSLVEEKGCSAGSACALVCYCETALKADALAADLENVGSSLAGGTDERGSLHLVAALLAADIHWACGSWALEAVLEESVVGVAGEAGGAGILLGALAVGQAGRAPLSVEEIGAWTCLSLGAN
jgi:hypothetical protein